MAPAEDVLTSDVLTSPEAGAKVIRGSAARVVGNGLGIVLGLISATLLLRHLGVANSGRYVTVMSLVAIAGSIADAGLNVTGTRDLAALPLGERRAFVANFLGLRLAIAPAALLAIVAFALIAGYPTSMVAGTAMAGAGLLIVSVADAALIQMTVQLRNTQLATIDVLKQTVTLAGIACLVSLGAHLTPFFAVQIAVGLAVLAATALMFRFKPFPLPRFERSAQRRLLGKALPIAGALVLGQVYFRLVVVLMSLISSPQQTGYFGGSLRAMETLVNIPILVAGVALPVLTAAARDDRLRLRYAIEGLSEGAVIAGVLVVIVTVRAAAPVMSLVGGPHFRPSGAVLRIQVGALLFIALYQIWMVSLIALGRHRDLILTNVIALGALAAFAAALVPTLGAEGGASASVLADATLACLVYWRLRRAAGKIVVRPRFLARVLIASAVASAGLAAPAVPDLAAAAIAALLYLGTGALIGMIPGEVRDALMLRSHLLRRGNA